MTGLQLPERLNAPAIIRELDRADAADRLVNYVRMAWSHVEPARQYIHGWHIDVVCEHLEAVTAGQVRRLLINVPPGFMKSLLCSVFWPTWEWGPRNLAHLRTMAASYTSSLTQRDNRRARSLIFSPMYQDLWGRQFRIMDDQNNKVKFENDKTGWMLATSVEGVGTGERADRVRVDDPHNVKDGESETVRNNALLWFTEVLPSRMNDPERSAIVVIMQRVHEDDVSGHILTHELGYEHLMLPMEFEPERRSYTVVRPPWGGVQVRARYLPQRQRWVREGEELATDEADFRQQLLEQEPRLVWNQDRRTQEGELLFPQRFTPEVVERDKRTMGAYAVAGQFQQRPTPRGGAMFERGWFRVVPASPEGGIVVRAWDLAASEKDRAAFTVGLRMRRHRGVFYIEHVARLRGSPGRVEELMKALAEGDDAIQRTRISVPQDPAQAGLSQRRNLSVLLVGHDVRFSLDSGKKEVRAEGLSAQAEAGNVCIVEGPWNREFLDEMTTFPMGRYKDQVDAASRAFSELVKMGNVAHDAPIGVPIQVGAGRLEPA